MISVGSLLTTFEMISIFEAAAAAAAANVSWSLKSNRHIKLSFSKTLIHTVATYDSQNRFLFCRFNRYIFFTQIFYCKILHGYKTLYLCASEEIENNYWARFYRREKNSQGKIKFYLYVHYKNWNYPRKGDLSEDALVIYKHVTPFVWIIAEVHYNGDILDSFLPSPSCLMEKD